MQRLCLWKMLIQEYLIKVKKVFKKIQNDIQRTPLFHNLTLNNE